MSGVSTIICLHWKTYHGGYMERSQTSEVNAFCFPSAHQERPGIATRIKFQQGSVGQPSVFFCLVNLGLSWVGWVADASLGKKKV